MLLKYFLFPVFTILSEPTWISTLLIIGSSQQVKVLVILDPLTEPTQRVAILKHPFVSYLHHEKSSKSTTCSAGALFQILCLLFFGQCQDILVASLWTGQFLEGQL